MARLKKGSAAAKAWGRRMQALRNRSSRKPKAKTSRKRSRNMAAKRKYTRRRRSTRSFFSSPEAQLAAGVAIATFTEPIADNMIARFLPQVSANGMDDLLKAGLGFIASKKTTGIIKRTAQAYMVFGIRNFVAQRTGRIIGVTNSPQLAATVGV